MKKIRMDELGAFQFESEIYTKLQEAERVAEESDVRYSAKEVLGMMKDSKDEAILHIY